MEALSGVASGIAVVSLAIQLVDCVGSIKTFIRNVKDAQKELERLVDLLERLEALLEDVRALMERQASLEHFPTPSATIFKCLKSCEKTLEPLQATVDKYTPSKSKVTTSVDRLKNGLRIGFKTKDIQDFETRIEREINFLQASLGANCGAILMQLGPALLKSQSNHEIIHQSSTVLSSSNTETAVVSPNKGDAMLSNAKVVRPSLSVIPVNSPLEKIGIYQRKIVRRAPGSKKDDETIISEDHETTLLWSILGRGLTWIQHRSFGRVVPSLHTFPVVNKFGSEISEVFKVGKVEDFQGLLRRGVAHPFSQDSEGWTLLHLASLYRRADIYLLLQNLGVKQSMNPSGYTPLNYALASSYKSKLSDPISTWRYILEDPELIDDFSPGGEPYLYHADFSINGSEWLYQQSANILHLEDACLIRASVVWETWKALCMAPYWQIPLLDYPSFDLDGKTLNAMKQGTIPLLSSMFFYCEDPDCSFLLGDRLLAWLSNSGLDVEDIISHEVELANTPDRVSEPHKRFVFESQKEGGWRLGFKYVFDREARGYLLLSVFETLMVGIVWSQDWPIYDSKTWGDPGFFEWRKNQKTRFERRMAARARKESGQKRCKRKMPGAWVH